MSSSFAANVPPPAADLPIEAAPVPAAASDVQAHAAEDAALHQAARGAEATGWGHVAARPSRRYDSERVDYTSSSVDLDSSKPLDAEARPRTTVLATDDVEEMAVEADLAPADLHEYSSDPLATEAQPCHSAPTSPTGLIQESRPIQVEPGSSQKAFVQKTSSASNPTSPTPRMFKRSHRAAASSSSPTKDAARGDAPTFKLKPILAKTHRQRQRSNSVPPNLALSPRSEGLSRKRSLETPDDAPLLTKKSRASVEAPVLKTAQVQVKAPSPPLSQHQLYTLHQLNLPRPAFLTDSVTASRAWSLRKGSSKSSSSVYGNAEITVPSMAPPITRHTLRELDLSEILRNPQLRHDIVFDSNLCFRPNFDGDRGAKKMLASERFWTAITREVSFGCRCTAYENASPEPLRCVCSAVGFSAAAVKTLVGRSAPASTGKVILNAVPLATRLPSRIPALVKELRSVLLSLLPANANPPFENLASVDDNASRKVIQATLDPDLIAQEVEHGVLDVASLGRFLGHTLKLHCAPMRDEMVDSMVACIESSDIDGSEVARGLRMAFDILELMKLDIANHQLRTLRPYLLDTAVDFELRSYLESADRRKSRAMEKTLSWISATSARTGCSEPSGLVRDGLLELLFRPDTRASSVNRSKSRRRHALSPSPASIPETLQLDTHRLQTLHSDLTDLTVVYSLLMLFNQVVAPARATEAQLEVVRREVWIIMHSNGIARSSGGLSPISSSAADQDQEPAPSPTHLSCAGWRKLTDDRFKESLQDVVLRLAVRAKMVQEGQTFASEEDEAPSSILPDTATVDLMSRWVEAHLQPTDALFLLLQNRLRATLDAMLGSAMDKHANGGKSWWITSVADAEPAPDMQASHADACSSFGGRHFDPASFDLGLPGRKRAREVDEDAEEPPRKRARLATPVVDYEVLIEGLLKRNGLLPLRHECQVVAERLGRVATFHLDAYKSLYTCMLTTAV